MKIRIGVLLAMCVMLAAWPIRADEARGGASGRAGGENLWLSRGIGGGGALYSPAFSPFDASEIYLVTDMSAVYHTKDLGRSWEMLDFPQLMGGIESDIRFTSDPQILYAIRLAEDLRTPVRSTDGGATWSALASDPTSGETYTLWADPASTSRLLVASYSVLYLSSDGGLSFHQVYTADDLHIAGAFFDGDTIYVGSRAGLLISTDGGATMSLSAAGGIPSDEAMVSFAGAKEGGVTRLWCVTLGSGDVWPLITGSEMSSFQGIYRLDTGDGTWTSITSGIGADDRPFFIAASPSDIDTVWLAGGNPSTSSPIVYRSVNGGGAWTPVLLTQNNANVATGWAGYHGDTDWWWGEYALGFAVSPTDPDRAILSDLGFAHLSTDGGATWRQAYVSADDENPAGAPTPKDLAYHGIGLEDTSSWWLSWTDSQSILASLTDIRGIRSEDGGRSWISGFSFGLPHNSTYMMISDPSDGKIYGATSSVHDLYQSTFLADSRIDGGDGALIVSSDGGQSFSILHDFGHPVVWLALDSSDSDTLYASVVHSTQGGIYVTHQLSQGASASWSRLGTPPRTEGHPYTVTVLDDGSLVCSYSGRRDASGAFTTSSGVFLSSDGGASWSDRSDAGMLRWTKDLVIDPHDSAQNTFYAAVFSHWGASPNEVGGIYRSTDRGLHWSRISDLYRAESILIDPQDADRAWVTTEASGLWYSENFSDPTPVFQRDEDFPFSHPTRVFLNPFRISQLWVTSFGGGLWTRELPIFRDGFEAGNLAAWSAVVGTL